MADKDVPDSTDWLATPLSDLAVVESALRCQVCKDFYKTPMITSCSHTFCSLCIRRALSNDGKCPLCRTSEQEIRLRSNWTLEETVDAFVKARSKTLELARSGGADDTSLKRKAEDDAPTEHLAPESKRLRSSARLSKNRTEVSTMSLVEADDDVEEILDDDDYVPEPEDGLVACPICHSRMKEWQVFRHVETCAGPAPQRQRQRKPANIGSPSTFNPRPPPKTIERLPALNYSLLKDTVLRKKMAELRISNQGPRPLLEKRHKEWITLWNANCDASRPKTRPELLQDLEIWEKTQGGRAPMMGASMQNAAAIKDKDFDGAAWAAKHDASFKDLIASARKSRMEAKGKAEEAEKEEKPPSIENTPTTPASAPAAAPAPVPASVETSQSAPVSLENQHAAISSTTSQMQSANTWPSAAPEIMHASSQHYQLPRIQNHWNPPSHYQQPVPPPEPVQASQVPPISPKEGLAQQDHNVAFSSERPMGSH